MIEDLEAELAGSLKENSNNDNLTVAEETNADEAITEVSKDSNRMEIYLKDEQNTKTYEETMNIDIENVNTI